MEGHGENQDQRQAFKELFESLLGLILIFPMAPHGPPCCALLILNLDPVEVAFDFPTRQP